MSVSFQGLQDLVELLFPVPPGCVLCGAQLNVPSASPPPPRGICEPPDRICPSCLNLAVLPPDSGCVKCGRPQPGPNGLCRRCWQLYPPFHRARAVGVYAGPLREAILRLKSAGESWLAEPLGALLACRLRSDFFPPDVVVPVPSHPSKERDRGYNQAELLARAVCRRLDLPLAPGLLVRRSGLPAQAGLSSTERDWNAAAAFRLAPGCGGRVAGKTVVLIDDILTTGGTAGACASALLAGGARQVDVLVLAVAMAD